VELPGAHQPALEPCPLGSVDIGPEIVTDHGDGRLRGRAVAVFRRSAIPPFRRVERSDGGLEELPVRLAADRGLRARRKLQRGDVRSGIDLETGWSLPVAPHLQRY
jgi:hypothetical protein